MQDRIERERAFHNVKFDPSAVRTQHRYGLMAPAKSSHVAYIRDHCAGRDVLEYGCGPDGYALMMAQAGARSVTAIDISDTAIEASTRRIAGAPGADRIRFVRMNAERLEFPDDAFDLVFGQAILHHLDLDRAYDELARVLRPGGSAAFLEPLDYNPAIKLFRKLTPHLRTPDEHPFLMGDIEAAGRRFERVDTDYFTLATMLALPLGPISPAAMSRAAAGLATVDQVLFRRLPPLRRYAWTVSLRMSGPRKRGAAADGTRAA